MNRAARTDLALDALNEERDHLTIQISLQDHAETPDPQRRWVALFMSRQTFVAIL